MVGVRPWIPLRVIVTLIFKMKIHVVTVGRQQR
jgi:hypothetical protein